MFVLFLALCFLAAARADVAEINGAVDKILRGVQEEIVKNGNTTLVIPEFSENFSYRWHFIKLQANLHCWEGVMRNTSTLQRIGDVKIANISGQLTLSIPLNLTDFEMAFNRCRVDLKYFFRSSSPVRVKINRHSLEAKVVLNQNDTNSECNVKLEEVRLTKLRKVKVDTGALIWEDKERILPHLIRHFLDKLIPFMSSYLKDLVKVYVPDAKFCYKVQ